MKKLLVLLLLVGLGVAAKVYYFRPPLLPVKTSPVRRGAVEETVTATSAGTVKPNREVKVHAELPGRIARVAYREGAQLKAGEVVIELARRSLEAQLAVAEANVTAARSQLESARLRLKWAQDDFKRVEALFNSRTEDRYVSNSELERKTTDRNLAEEAVRSADSNLAQMEAQRQVVLADLEKTRILAPFDGVLTKLHVEEGGAAGVASPLFEVMDLSTLYVLAPFDEVDAGKIRLGQAVRLSFDAFPGHVFASKVFEILPVVNTTQVKNRTLDVKLSLDDREHRFVVGMSADVTIVTGRKEDTLYVATKSIKNVEYAYVLEGGRIHQRHIVPGLTNWDTTEVCEGLQAGEAVISLLDLDEPGELEGREAVARP